MNPRQLELLPMDLEAIYYNSTNRIMSDIVQRILKYQSITASELQISTLIESRQPFDFINSEIKRLTKLSDSEYDKMISEVIESDYVKAKTIYDKTKTVYIPIEQNEYMQTQLNAFSIQAKSRMFDIAENMGLAVFQNGKNSFVPLNLYYKNQVNSAIFEISNGLFSYDQVLKRVVKEMTNSGIRTLSIDGFRTMNIVPAARMSVMSSVNQLSSLVNEYNAEQLGTEMFEVTRHNGARPDHQIWQGKVFSMDKLISVCGLGSIDGLAGANCRHAYLPFINGVSERNYTDKELAELNQKENQKISYRGVEFNEFEAAQQQRKIEKSMRLQRSRIDLLNKGNSDASAEKARYRLMSAEYRGFSKTMNLPEQRARVTVDGLGRLV